MAYAVGDPVVFAAEGATIIRAITTSEFAGRAWIKVVLGYPFDRTNPDRILHPLVGDDDLAPLARVLGPGGVPAVLAVLASPAPAEPSDTWATVQDTYLTMIGGRPAEAERHGGPAVLDARQVAEVVRNLTAQRHRGRLDVERSRLLDRARAVLVSEVALGAGLDRRQAEATIDEALGR